MKNIIQFCDFLIDRLSQHGVVTGRKPLLLPIAFVLQFAAALEAIGIREILSAELDLVSKKSKREEFVGSYFHQNLPLLLQSLRFFRSILEVLVDFDEKVLTFPKTSLLSGLKTMLSWNLDQFVPFAKYVTAYPMAKFLSNELPEKPEGFKHHPLLFSGAIKRFLANRLNSKSTKNARLAFGYLQGVKRGCAKVPDSYIQKSYEKHRSAISKVVSTPWGYRVDFAERLARFFRNFKETLPRLYEASHSASFETVRSSGGAKGGVARDYLGSGISFILGKHTDELYRMEEVRPGFVKEARSRIIPITLEDVRNGIRKTRQNFDDMLPVMVAAVCEPLKVRLITKGSTWAYYFSKFYQKHLWGYLQKFPQFCLTGRPLQESDLHDLLSREVNISLDLGKDSFWVSGDYSAATDNLNLDLTKDVFNESLRLSGLSDEDKDFLRSVIFEQQICYPHTSFLGPVTQRNGQLMGSTLSFPILCIVNLICYWMALEEYTGKSIKIRHLPVLVNGDDIGFRANKTLYSIWKEKIALAGFTLSLGKNYTSKNYFTINSQLYHHTQIGNSHRFTALGFFNVGLVQGNQVDLREKAVKPIWDNYNTVMSGAVSKIFAHRRFFTYNFEQISRITNRGNINLFASPFLGGIGFNFHDELKPYIKFTHFQKRLGGFLLNLLKSFQPSEYMEEFTDFVSRRIALIDPNQRARPKSLLTRYHLGRYTVIPAFGPLNSTCKEILDRSYPTPVMADDDIEPGDLTLNPIPSKILKAVRLESKNGESSFSTKTRPSRLYSFPYRVVEFIGSTEIDEGASPFISMEQYFE